MRLLFSLLICASALVTPFRPDSAEANTPPAILDPGRSPSAVEFYRLRVEISTTTNWTELRLLDASDSAISARNVAVAGHPTLLRVDPTYIRIEQPYESALQGSKVSVITDIALSPIALRRPLKLLSEKGAFNLTTINLSLLSSDGKVELRRIEHDGWVPGNTDRNPLTLEVPLPPHFTLAPLTHAVTKATPKLALAFYYPWYHMLQWSSPILDDRPLTQYASHDRSAIARHIAQARAAGLDGFVCSWWGPDTHPNGNFKLVLDEASAQNFRAAVHLETLTGDGEIRSPAELKQWILYVLSNYGTHPAYLRIDGKPVVFVWATNLLPIQTWEQIFVGVRAEGYDAIFLPNGYDHQYLDVFDGLSRYDVGSYENLSQTYSAASRATRNYGLLSGSSSRRIWAATVQPGYDDTRIPGRTPSRKDRADGAFFWSTIQAAVQSDPDWILITTWNEWWEHTYIEPSERYGERYLDITREFLGRWRAEST
jgi:hypothetical protein